MNMNDRELINAALLRHTAHARRLAVGAEKRRLDKLLKAEGLSVFSPAYSQQGEAPRQLTELKRRELAALRELAKACARQRGRLDVADVIDLDGAVTLLAAV
jgi:uncharacterized membrane protein YqiK